MGVGCASGQWYPFALYYTVAGTPGLYLYMSANGSAADIGSLAVAQAKFTTNVWHHLAVTRGSGLVRVWFNGTKEAEFTAPGTWYENGYPWGLGVIMYNGALYGQMNGYIDEFRLSTSCKYTDTFTPSSVPFPLQATGNTELKVVDSAGNRTTLSGVD
jgi:hypothetical protein